MAVIWTGDRVSAWGTWQGPGPDGPANNGTAGTMADRRSDDFATIPPDARWDRSIRMKRNQGDYSQWIVADQGSLSRAQLQGPGIYPMNTDRWTEWWVYFRSIAFNASDDFHMYIETHTPSANPGGIWTGNLSGSTNEMLRQWIGPGSFTHAYRSKVPVVFSTWNHYRVHFRPATGSTGAITFYRNATLAWSQTGITTTTQSGTHYPEIGFYTYWSIAGSDDMNIAGFRVHDSDPGYPGATGAPINTTGAQTAIANGFNVVGGTSVDFANDPDRISARAAELSSSSAVGMAPEDWRRRGRIFVPCDLPAARRLVRV